MFDVAVVGTGYVGLVTGTCLADMGNYVTCLDIDEKKIEGLKRGELPIYEPGLAELVADNVEEDRLRFTTRLPREISFDLIFITVGTPSGPDGQLSISGIVSAVTKLLPLTNDHPIIVIKSTVPPGTIDYLQGCVKKAGRRNQVVSNPEFLKEGHAVEDFRRPDRIIIGSTSAEAIEVMKHLYEPFVLNGHPLLVMSPINAEISKLAANAMLASRVSFMNSLADFCEAAGGDIGDVRQGIGNDRRVGMDFLHAGPGWGGSCFGKDVCGLQAAARSLGLDLPILEATLEVNDHQKRWLFRQLQVHFGNGARDLDKKTIGIWGLAFKPGTDDVRESPAIAIGQSLLLARANNAPLLNLTIKTYDPKAMDNFRRELSMETGKELAYCQSALEAATGTDALLIVTEWPEFRQANLAKLAEVMKQRVIIDGRRLFHPEETAKHGFTYYSVGRSVARPR